jgi:hypothetical protein
MSENNQQKGVSLLIMLLLVTVSPTLVLSSDNDTVRLAQAQSANQTSSATTAADTQTPFPSSQSTQTMQETFHAKGLLEFWFSTPMQFQMCLLPQSSLELSLVGIGALML